eukprot:CAMPEP_0181184476 /NCGR_PEP_ID=MMETSP1096-20121128/8987_1 /TAXON_ID=156174 ORGANISM="Chrysochromulina ericina, Strain CCMP281" /NCGR_SAMPLE_ID=MMETSP1096 /ASSEMBLY_ACC=CAM_ASM_000453 /LENGTH=156 /DNA_ID=CAMNT_0023273241 /DNA_START=708 /DNA_END=1179 /DNA_ORIENTATION=+
MGPPSAGVLLRLNPGARSIGNPHLKHTQRQQELRNVRIGGDEVVDERRVAALVQFWYARRRLSNIKDLLCRRPQPVRVTVVRQTHLPDLVDTPPPQQLPHRLLTAWPSAEDFPAMVGSRRSSSHRSRACQPSSGAQRERAIDLPEGEVLQFALAVL